MHQMPGTAGRAKAVAGEGGNKGKRERDGEEKEKGGNEGMEGVAANPQKFSDVDAYDTNRYRDVRASRDAEQ